MIGSHNSDIGLAFYNDRVKEIMDASIMAEPFTYVPITAGHVELVGGNALVFGKIKEGYDTITPRVDVEIAYEAMPVSAGITAGVTYFKTSETYVAFTPPDTDLHIIYREIHGIVIIGFSLFVREGDIYYLNVRHPELTDTAMDGTQTIVPAVNVTGTYTVQHGDDISDVTTGLIADLNAKGITTDIIPSGLPQVINMYPRVNAFRESPIYEAGDVTTLYKDFTFTVTISSVTLSTKFSILKCGAIQGFGIVYKDRAGRQCSVVKDPTMSIYLPFYSEKAENLIESIAKLKFKIFHTPPDWAETYEIVYFGNLSMDYFMQIRADAIETALTGVNRYAININDTFEWTSAQNNRWKVAPYVWEQGDRLRLIGTVNTGTGVVTKYNTPGATYDYEIEETGTDYGAAIGGDWLICQAVEKPTPFVGETNILVEVYRPRKGLGQTVPYGTGMVFDIGVNTHGHRYHKGDVDQVFDSNGLCTTPAEVKNTANDSWKFLRLNYIHNTGNVWPFWTESILPSDWWGGQTLSTKLTSQGFPFLDDLSQRQTVLPERFRFGGALIEGTRTNNIAHFTFNNFRDLQRKNGEITGMRETGYTLNIVQMYKETSVYINRRQTFNPDGTSQFVLTDSFIGDIRPLDTDYGCQHPDSITVNGRNLYYWDNSQGRFIRSAPNGQLALDIKMKRWFDDLKKWIATNGGASVLQTRTGINNDHDEIWMTFRMGDEIQGLIFSEKKGRYVAEINQITESYVHIGNFFAHLYQQRLWIMNIDEGQDFLSWGGTPTYAEIEVVSNVDSLKNKVLNAVAIFADHLLQSLARTVVIPAEASGSNELMETNIPVFERKEGVYFGKIMKDENSKGNFLTVLARKLNGRQMRGRYAFLKFRTEEHSEKVRIDSIVIFSTPSERNI
jgi:hypothetical protein